MNVYEIITDRIVEQLQRGVVPWRKPWIAGAPQNLITRKAYRGINPIMLASTGYASPYWLTFRQCKQKGGSVKKGEHGAPVVFWKWHKKEDRETGERVSFPVLRYYTVFNVSQTTVEAPQVDLREHTPIEACEALVDGMPNAPRIEHGAPQAFYRPSGDLVNMPAPELFDSAEAYYATLFHELTHSTGHKTRLDRSGGKRFGDASYSREELVAEMGSAFLCGHTGIDPVTIDNAASYIDSWLRRLRGDSKLVVTAAAQAQKAADYIRGIEWTEDD